MNSASANIYRLEVGPVTIELVCDSPEYANSLASYFGRKSSLNTPDISLELNIVSHRTIPDIPDSLVANKVFDGNEFTIADGLICGSFDPQTATGRLDVKNILTKGHYPRVFEQVLYQAAQSAFRIKGIHALMVHSSSAIARDSGFLFVGASGTGKSTVAQLSSSYQVLNDEMNLIQYVDEGPILHGTPFNGFFREKVPGIAPLEAILLLAHGPAHELAPLGAAEAVSVLAAQICPPIGLEDPFFPDIRFRMLDLAEELVNAVAIRRMKFTPDSGFWDLILQQFGKDSDQ